MAAGELLLSAFLSVLFDRLASRELVDFARQERLRSLLRRWQNTLMMIQEVLNGVKGQQLTDGAVKTWLDDLQDLAYDLEDILDRFAYEALRRRLVAKRQTTTGKVWNFIPDSFTTLKFNSSMRFKIQGITSRMEDLFRRSNEFRLIQVIPGGTLTVARQRPSSTSVPSETAVYGRDEDKAKILKMVLREEPTVHAPFHITAIVGMGGIGKTTLARQVFNDKALEEFKFDIKAWVYVSGDFDVLEISKALFESITSQPCYLKNLNEVQVQLEKLVHGKKFLFVLDDVWNKNYVLWENLKSPFMSGASGSKIIVTTREVKVASTMRPLELYSLNVLSDDDCWSLFKKHAYESRDNGSQRSLEFIRKQVLKKCAGLPLAAMALGGLLRREDSWEDILNGDSWDLPEEGGILPVLRLSYHHLPSYLKRCFAYCGIFPRGYEFDEGELILLWMAEGLIPASANNKQLEDMAREYFHDLSSRSIFQQSSKNSSKFVMHDLIHDVAQLVSKGTSFRLEEANKQSVRSERVRHSSYICDDYDCKNKFEVFKKFKRLRTFLPVLRSGDEAIHQYITSMVLFDLLPKFKKLRVLSLKRYYISKLPDAIGSLKHLRYLNLFGTMIESLPEATSFLFNLQILILRDCFRLKMLPYNMRNLINLYHLDIKGANLLEKMPPGMKELKQLHKLSNFIVSEGIGSSLKELKHLKFLHGELCISKLENMSDLYDVSEPILSDLQDLEKLLLEWGSHFNETRNEEAEQNILNMLQPHRNLKELAIKYYGGGRFPSWIGDPLFSNITVLKLENCEKCTSLPSLGLLGSLKDLTIEGMAGIKSIGLEIYGGDHSEHFQSLETLKFENLQEWEYWDPIKEVEDVERFPSLRELFIIRCPKLAGKFPDNLPSLETLMISQCAQLVVEYSSLPVLRNLKIDECKGMVCCRSTLSESLMSVTLSKVQKFGTSIQGIRQLEYLKIVDCQELIHHRQHGIRLEKAPAWLQNLTSVRELNIENCKEVVYFPEANILSNLSCFKIENCDRLKCLPEELLHDNAHLESLEIKGCNAVTFIVQGMLPASLERLEISNCEKLQCIVDDNCASSSYSSTMHTNLMYLYISDCPSLTCISSTGQLPGKLKDLGIKNCSEIRALSSQSQLPESLEYLYVYNCSKLEKTAERFHSNTRLRCIWLWNCENLRSIPDGLNKLSCLEQIDIRNCPSLVCFPEGGLPNTKLNVTIISCEQLYALPDCMNNLSYLQRLEITFCPSLHMPLILEGGFPTNLKELSISAPNLYRTLVDWGLRRFTSLRGLYIDECPDAITFSGRGDANDVAHVSN